MNLVTKYTTKNIPEGWVLIESSNITTLAGGDSILTERDAHHIAFQEHKQSMPAIDKHRANFNQNGWQMEASPPNPNTKIPSGGVGLITRKPLIMVSLPPITPQLQKERTKTSVFAAAPIFRLFGLHFSSSKLIFGRKKYLQKTTRIF